MTYINKTDESSVNFVAPAGLTGKNEVLFPIGEILAEKAYAAAVSLSPKQMVSNASIAPLTGNVIVSANINSQLSAGAELILTVTASGADRTVSFNSNITGEDIIVLSGKSKNILMKFNGTEYLVIG